MIIFQSLIHILLAYILLLLMGLGLALCCLSKKFRVYSFFISPAIGYIAFCFLSIWLSGLTDAALVRTNVWSLTGLFALTIFALLRYRAEIIIFIRAAWVVPLVLGAMLVFVFFPALQQGLDLYIGTANPDFYQSLSLHEALIRFSARFWVRHTDLPLAGPFLDMFPAAFQARFGGVAFSILLEQLFGVPSRTALMTAVVVFLLCLPATVYFFCSTVLEFSKKESTLSAVLVAVAAPTAMSFVHTFIGQNSALATFPLAISLIYLALKERSITLTLLAAIVINGVFWIYVMALPYVFAPFGLYCAIKIFRQGWRPLIGWPIQIGVAAAISVVVHFSVYSESRQFVSDLTELLGKLTQSHYYSDFLTEEVFQYANGLTSYPLSQSMFFSSVSHTVAPILIGLGILLGGLHLLAVRLWSKNASRDAVSITVALIATYAVVWVKYTFLTRYGYASFKMAAWLQFLVAPFFAWGILRSWEAVRKIPHSIARWRYCAMFGLLVSYVGLNLASDVDYEAKSFGRDRFHGSLINSYGIGGNQDFLDLSAELSSRLPKGCTVALGFGDSIENYWAAYYAGHAVDRVTMLTHEEIPFEDAFLPEIHSRQYVDSLGNTQTDVQKYFNGGIADYYLLPGKENLNTEIIDRRLTGKPLWSNGTFALYKKSDISDLITMGRGFYRVEHMDIGRLGWWWPEVFRWSAEGGEIYHLLPSTPGKPYRVAFSAITGLGQISGRRTVEFWHNGEKFDEVVIEGAGRFVSKPYYPIDGVNRIVLRIKEKSVLVARDIGLWNRDLARRSTPINILFSNVNLISDSEAPAAVFPLDEAIKPKALFDKVETFNGFDVDGWVRSRSVFTVRTLSAANKAEIEILLPGNLNFRFPYKVQFLINGVSFEKSFAKAGEYVVSLDLSRVKSDILRLEIIPQDAKRIAEGMEQREVLQSIRLSSIKLLTH